MSYLPIPGSIPGGLGIFDWLFPGETAVEAGVEKAKEPTLWESFVEGAAVTRPPPEEPGPGKPGVPEIAPEPPPGGPSFFQRYKAPIVAAGILGAYLVWKGRKR